MNEPANPPSTADDPAPTPAAAASLDHRAVDKAAVFLRSLLTRTPLLRSPPLDALAGATLWLKAENMQRIGAFKARGAQYCVGQLSPQQRRAGIISYSSGNHAQAVALAARHHHIRADIAMPEDAPASKVAAVKQLGANIQFAGTTSEHRHQAALEMQRRSGGHIVEPFDDPHIIAGQGTATLELLDEVARRGHQLDALLVPVGGGGLIAGACLVASVRGVPVYAVEPVGCDALGQSLAAGRRVAVQPSDTIADGLKPTRVGALNFAVAKRHVAGAIRVTEEQIGRSLTTLLWAARSLVEPSGAAALAAALCRLLPGSPKHVGVILSGGNIGPARLSLLLERYPAWPWTR